MYEIKLKNGAFSGINDFILSFEHFATSSMLVERVMKVIYLVGREMIPLREDKQYLNLRDFGVCLFTHLFLSILRPKQTQTNHKCQRYCVFVFVILQERIFKKLAKIRPKRIKTSTSLEIISKARSGEANYHF